MMKASLLTTTATLAVASAASADFVGFDGVVEQVGDYTVIKMYAVYDQADIALNVFGAVIDTADQGGFHHSDVQAGAGGTWSPGSSLDIPGFADSNIDSFANMGYGVGADAAFNSTSLDPTFIDATAGLGAYVPAGAGWFNGNPAGDIVAGAVEGVGDYAVWVGQFSFATSRVDADPNGGLGFFVFDAEMGSKDADGTVFFGQSTYVWQIPAPGALALLGLGGFAARRRRG